jgi:ADP-ribose pyrophosphatase
MIMSFPVEIPDQQNNWVEILEETEVYTFGKKQFRIDQATLRFRKFDGLMSAPITRINFERGDSVGVLLYDPGDDVVILVRQFRYPVLAGLKLREKTGYEERKAWPLEIIAGVAERDVTVKEVAHKEILIEAGYRIKGDLLPIYTIYPSPGGSSERIYLFLGHVDQRKKEVKGGGVLAEGEDIQVVAIPFEEAMALIENGEIEDAKTIIALQYLAIQKLNELPMG